MSLRSILTAFVGLIWWIHQDRSEATIDEAKRNQWIKTNMGSSEAESEDTPCLSATKCESECRTLRYFHVDNRNTVWQLISGGRLIGLLYICLASQRELARTTWTISRESGVAFYSEHPSWRMIDFYRYRFRLRYLSWCKGYLGLHWLDRVLIAKGVRDLGLVSLRHISIYTNWCL